MKWLIVALSTMALLFSGYAVYKTKRIDAATKSQIRLIASVAR